MKKKIIIALCIIFAFIAGVLVGGFLLIEDKQEESIANIDIKYHKGEKYYIIKDDYKGEYDYQELELQEGFDGTDEEVADKIKLFNTTEILTLKEYQDFCEKWGLKVKYKDPGKLYMLVAYASDNQYIVKARLANAVETNDQVKLYLWEDVAGFTNNVSAYVLVVPVEWSTHRKEINVVYTEKEYNNLIKYGVPYENPIGEEKPIIYIYPEEEMNVSVKLKNSSLITTSYPKYNDGWNVLASPDGTLKDPETNRSYYGLYYEGKNNNVTMQEDGFIVKGEDTTLFLEEKLEILGLNEREINEFIIYWLPRLENNKYNYIRFETKEEIENYMPLEISPEPDTVIRVVMNFKALDEKVKIKEQILTPIKRSGYTVVEWGGSEIK